MLKVLRQGAPGFDEPTIEAGSSWVLPADAVWIELISPTRPEELAVEQALGVLHGEGQWGEVGSGGGGGGRAVAAAQAVNVAHCHQGVSCRAWRAAALTQLVA